MEFDNGLEVSQQDYGLLSKQARIVICRSLVFYSYAPCITPLLSKHPLSLSGSLLPMLSLLAGAQTEIPEGAVGRCCLTGGVL